MWITHSRQNLQEVRVILRSIDQSAPLDQHLTIKSLLIGKHLRDMHTKVPFWNRTFETFFYQRLYGNKRSLFLHLDPTLLLYCFKQWTVPHFIYEYFAYITGSFLSILETSGFPLEFTDTFFFLSLLLVSCILDKDKF